MGARRAVCGLLASVVLLAGRPCAATPCAGDCNANSAVTVDELLDGVSAGLGNPPPTTCPAFDGTASAVTIDVLLAAVNRARFGCTPVNTPVLLSSQPSTGAVGVPRTEWIRLTFSGPVEPSALRGFQLKCDGTPQEVSVSALAPDVLIANPEHELPAGATCVLTWPGPSGPVTLSVSTAAAGPTASVLYDRTNLRSTAPFPDDFWLTTDATTPTGVRVAVPIPAGPNDVKTIFRILLQETNKLDGFSPIAHFVIELSDPPDAASLPQTPADSLDPLATVALLDLTAGEQFGQRVPFRVQIRSDMSVSGAISHCLLVFPSIPLTPGGQYGVVVTRRARVDAGRPLEPSPFLRAAMAPAVEGESAAVTRVRALIADVLDAAAATTPPIPVDDVALALRITVRTTDDIPNDLLAIKQQVLDSPPPAVTVTSVEPDTVGGSDVAAIVRGTWEAPDWRSGQYLARDASGQPVQMLTHAVPFILALPKAALSGPVPLTMYQHGNPGSAEAEVPGQARRSLAAAGFAVIGFTDNLNREVSAGISDDTAAITAQITAVFSALIARRKVPDYWVETNAEQIAFVRMLQGIGSLDVLPIDAPDHVPDIDTAAPLTYLGISEGANHAPGLLPYAPEIHAAALVAGGARLTEVLIHQQADAFLTQLGPLFPSLTPADIWVDLTLFQAIFDIQDPHNHARFIYRAPHQVAGTLQKASILLIEGLDDSLVPNNATDSLAWGMGPIPHLNPVQRPVPFLETVDGPITANIDAHTTAAFFQYVPVGVAGIAATPGCAVLPSSIGAEGHYCAQSAAESLHQRVIFFQTAVDDPVPTIINPFAE